MIKNFSDNLDRCLIEAHLTELPEKWDGKSDYDKCIALVEKGGSGRQFVIGKRGDGNSVHYLKVWDTLLITKLIHIYPYKEMSDDSFNIPFTRQELTAKIKEINSSFDLRTLRTKADIDIYRIYNKMLNGIDTTKKLVIDEISESKGK